MIICRTPYRVSFFGGGTDYPAWYKEHGGQVFAAAIDKYCWLTARRLPPFFDHKYRLVYRKIETCSRIEDIEHPAIKAALSHVDYYDSLELHHDGDLPSRSGMGSSSAFTVGLLHCLYRLKNCSKDVYDLIGDAITLEQYVLKETVGSQDQVMTAHGGMLLAQFGSVPRQNNFRSLLHMGSQIKTLQSHCMLFYTGVPRTASEVASSYKMNEKVLTKIGELVAPGFEVFNQQDMPEFGRLLTESWSLKIELSSKVENGHAANIFQIARKHGAYGGKLLGAGGGGFMLLIVPPERHNRVRIALSEYLHVPFKFEREGSKIVFEEE